MISTVSLYRFCTHHCIPWYSSRPQRCQLPFSSCHSPEPVLPANNNPVCLPKSRVYEPSHANILTTYQQTKSDSLSNKNEILECLTHCTVSNLNYYFFPVLFRVINLLSFSIPVVGTFNRVNVFYAGSRKPLARVSLSCFYYLLGKLEMKKRLPSEGISSWLNMAMVPRYAVASGMVLYRARKYVEGRRVIVSPPVMLL